MGSKAITRVLLGLGALALASGVGAQVQNVRIMAPATAGGGWDGTARALQGAFTDLKAFKGEVEVYNVPGYGGTVGLSQFSKMKGDANQLMVMGMVMTGAVLTNKSTATLADVTPIARLTAEYETIVVPAASSYKSLADLTSAFKANPASITWGGSSAGGSGHILVGLIARDLGVSTANTKFVPSSGGGQAAKAMLAGELTAISGGYSEFAEGVRKGELRALAISAPRRVKGINVPTLMEQGINLEFANWRGVVAPPGISAREKNTLELAFARLARSSQWREVLEKNGWNSYFLAGEPFRYFLERENARVEAILKDLGVVQ